MDLGATVCTPREPNCGCCPLQAICQARQKELTAVLPVARKKAKLPVRQQIALIVSHADELLLRQRPPEGFLGGLWEFPTVDLPAGLDAEQVAVCLVADLCLHGSLKKVGEIRHAYSHFKLELSVYRVAAGGAEGIAEASTYRWFSGTELESLPLHGAHRKAYGQFEKDS